MGGHTAQQTLLLVDDVKLIRELGSSYLAGTDVRVVEASNGLEALDVIHRLQPDLVLLDLFMPTMSGDECCRRIKHSEFLRHIPVVMVTRADRDYLLKCVDANCDDILQKPYTPEKFLAVCRRFLKLAQARTERKINLKLFYGNHETPFNHDFSFDLGAGGIFIRTKQLLPVNTPLTFIFTFPAEGRRFEFKAWVSWQNTAEYPIVSQLPQGMAVQFEDMCPDKSWVFCEFIRQMKTAHADDATDWRNVGFAPELSSQFG